MQFSLVGAGYWGAKLKKELEKVKKARKALEKDT